MLRLRFVVNGEDRVFPLSGSRVRLGRSSDNDVVLADVSVSRFHAEILRDAGEWSVHDLKSTNCVEVNGVPVEKALLHPGYRLNIGSFEMWVEGGDSFSVQPESRAHELGSGLPDLANATIIRSLKDFEADYGLTGTIAVSPESRAHELGGGLPDLANATIIRPLKDFEADYGLTGTIAVSPANQAGDIAGDQTYVQRMFGFFTRLARVLTVADSVDEVLERVLGLAFETFPVDRGFILLSNDSGELIYELVRIRDKAWFRPSDDEMGVSVSRNMLRTMMNERVALVTVDARNDQRLSGGERINLYQIRSAMCAPLWSGDQIMGVIQVDSPIHAGAFGERDLDALTALAHYAAVAVGRIRYARKAELERQVRSRLERSHSPGIIEDVLARSDEGLQRLQSTQATVLFADLVGFTAFAENSPPEQVAESLDAFLNLAVEAIFRAGGTLDKFIGDCVIAFFGAPMAQDDHALRAVRAAIEIQDGLAAWNAARVHEGLPCFKARMVLNSGPVVVVDIGSAGRMDYTVLGNTVNVAACLETFVAQPDEVVLGATTHHLLGDAIPTEPLGEFQLSGLQQRIPVYRVVRGDSHKVSMTAPLTPADDIENKTIPVNLPPASTFLDLEPHEWILREELNVDEAIPPASLPEDESLKILAAVSRVAAHSRSRSAMLEGFLREITLAFPKGIRSSILLVEDGELIPQVFWPPGRSFVSFTLAKEVLRSKQALSWTSDCKVFADASSLGLTVHACYAPMLCKGEVLGVIHLDSISPFYIFKPQGLEILSVIGHTIGPAIKAAPEGGLWEIPSIFISYAREDRALVDRLVARLRRCRIKVWLDERLRAGELWRLEIDAAIKRVDALVLIVSLASVDSEEVNRELRTALDLSKIILPAMLHPTPMPELVSGIQYLDLTEDFERGVATLAERIHELRATP